MKALLKHRYALRHNLFMLIGVCLCIYFTYHAVQGNRSFLTLMQLDQKIATMSLENAKLQSDRMDLEQKVAMMRPESLNKDLLEERIRLILGYKHKDDLVVLSN